MPHPAASRGLLLPEVSGNEFLLDNIGLVEDSVARPVISKSRQRDIFHLSCKGTNVP